MDDQIPAAVGADPSALFRFESGSPVRVGEEPEDQLRPGPALALSGGGYRAMLFHAGTVLRLNEAGMLPTLQRVSSVSGGSITAGVLARHWTALELDQAGRATNLTELVVEPLRTLARTRVDVPAVLGGLALPFTAISDRVERKIDRVLFDGARLSDLPDEPRFVFNATNLESGVLLRFSKPYAADYRVGIIDHPDFPLASAVTASAAFPPFLSPYELDATGQSWRDSGDDDLSGPGFREEIFLSDGGVYDNLGLESVWKSFETVLVSDAGGMFHVDDEPDRDWGRHMLRVLHIIDSQVRALRKRLVVDALRRGERKGFYISTSSDLSDYPNGPHLPARAEVTDRLAGLPTRLAPMGEADQELLINWGYAATDAGIRGYLDPTAPVPVLPYPERPLA
jgi:NTE family protein